MNTGVPTPDLTGTLIRSLQNPALYDHPVDHFSVIETHISWVLLTGRFAYKFKKPVNLGFVDFSSLDKRKFYCSEELRLNRRFAADLYLEVVAIRGTYDQPHLRHEGMVIEYAVKMREFRQQELLSHFAEGQILKPEHIDSIADVIADFHYTAEPLDSNSLFGSARTILKWSKENFDHMEAIMPANVLPEIFQALKQWCLKMNEERLSLIRQRRDAGFVRDCHGDLHLGNLAVIKGQVTPFDCIEFNPELRCIDTTSEIAFVAMDLQARGYTQGAWQFINRYLQNTGDYEGNGLLRYYIVYRALVRAKVEALRLVQTGLGGDRDDKHYQEVYRYLRLAHSWLKNARPALIVMHGLSGSGKSTLAKGLVGTVAAIQIRSDVERKRLFNLDPGDDSASSPGQGLYTQKASAQTYDRLYDLASNIIATGFTVIVDATFLNLADRQRFEGLAQKCRVPHVMISCEAPENLLRDRIRLRSRMQKDPSEANLEVLQLQLQSQDLITREERDHSEVISCTQSSLSPDQIIRLMQLVSAYHPPGEN